MKVCNGCGGVVDKDCHHPIECEQIARLEADYHPLQQGSDINHEKLEQTTS